MMPEQPNPKYTQDKALKGGLPGGAVGGALATLLVTYADMEAEAALAVVTLMSAAGGYIGTYLAPKNKAKL